MARQGKPRWDLSRSTKLNLPGRFASFSLSAQIAALFAYWLYMAAAGIFAGYSVLASLALSLFMLGLAVGLYLAYQAARSSLEDDIFGRAAIAIVGGLALLVGGVVILVPFVVALSLILWGIFKLPLLLMRG
jgi:hypothetical protein